MDILSQNPLNLGQSLETQYLLAGIDEANNELQFASGTESSLASSELTIENIDTGNDDFLLPQKRSGVLNVGQDESEVSGTSLELSKDKLTSNTNGITIGVTDTLTGANTDGISIQRRSSRGSDLAGNSKKKAYNIGELDGTDFYTDSVSRSDRKDFYKFNVETKGQIEIDLSGLSGNADLYLRDSKGKLVEKSKLSGSRSESIRDILNPGEYFIQVQSRNKWVSTDYHLGMRFSQVTSFNKSVGGSATNRGIFSFTLDEKKDLDVSLSNLTRNADLYLVDSNNKVIDKSRRGGKSSEEIKETLLPGAYEVQVRPRNRKVTSNYTIDFSFLSSDAGNNRSTARNFGTLAPNQYVRLKESVSWYDRNDFFKFTLEEGAEIDISLGGLSDNADLYLRNSRGKVIEKSKNSGSAAESIADTLSPGDYYIQVKPRTKWDSTDYYLGFELEGLPVDNAGNSRDKALSIGNLLEVKSYEDYVGVGDRRDYYTFTLDWERVVNISLDGLNGNADLFLSDESGNLIEKSKLGGVNAETIERSLAAGTYYVQVKPRNNRVNTDYVLTLEPEKNEETLAVIEENLNVPGLEDIGFELIEEPVEVEKGVYFIGVGPAPEQFDPTPFNASSAETTKANQLWSDSDPGLGLNLDGSGVTVGVWDRGKVRDTHEALKGRVTIGDGATEYDAHATHVAGTIGASDVDPDVDSKARGMARQVEIITFDFHNDLEEIGTVASEIDISNHSYGNLTGWFNEGWENNGEKVYDWFWMAPLNEYSDPDKDEDANFGKYSNYSGALDLKLYTNPHLLSIWAAGNDRDDVYERSDEDPYYLATFSEVPDGLEYKLEEYQKHWYAVFPDDSSYSTPSIDGKGIGYDTLAVAQNAKNTLVVGAIDDNKQMADFSSWGPTDDGRIKPDVVGNGVDVESTGSKHDADYYLDSGTSMAAPNVTGTAALLHQHYTNLYGSETKPSSATMKGLLTHTAEDLGNVGPDYIYGWGLVDGAAAANFLTDSKAEDGSILRPDQSYTGTTQPIEITSDGSGPLKISMVWTDPAKPETVHGDGLDERTPVLVNDLDLTIVAADGTIYYPWTLDPANPEDEAKDYKKNSVDNVEQVRIDNPVAGTYTIYVNHTGTLSGGEQKYSLFASGLGNEEIEVTLPNGGNTLEVGKSYDITWDDNIEGNLKIELYKNGVFDSTIISETESDGLHSWTVGEAIASGSDYQVKITSLSDGNIFDFSNANFTITPKSFIQVDTPNDGKVGENLNITWADNVSGNTKLELHQDGELVTAIAEVVETQQSYHWQIPDTIPAGNNYQVKVTNADGTVSDLSDGNFSIEALADYINITSPNGGETLVAGQEYDITWESNLGEIVSIEVYQEDLLSYTENLQQLKTLRETLGFLADDFPNSRLGDDLLTENDGSYTYTWKVPIGFAEGNNYKIKVSGENGVFDLSESSFSIDSETLLNVSSPNGGEALEVGETYNISWDDNISGDVVIDLFKGGVLDRTIASIKGVANSPYLNSYEWTVPEDIVIGDDYTIQVSHSNEIDDFNINTWNEEGTIMITGREPEPFAEVVNYDKSDSYFSIAPLEYIELTSINNGETLEPGETYEITWDTNITGNVRIDLYEEDSPYDFLNYSSGDRLLRITVGLMRANELGLDEYDESLIGGGLAEDGSYTWTVPEDFVAGDEYKFKITSISDDTVYDFSNSQFSVEVAEYITLTSLDAFEIIGIDPQPTYPITWDTNITGDVKIELYQGGLLSHTINDAVASSLGSYIWTVPEDLVDSGEYEIKITSINDGTVYDFSNSKFRVGYVSSAALKTTAFINNL